MSDSVEPPPQGNKRPQFFDSQFFLLLIILFGIYLMVRQLQPTPTQELIYSELLDEVAAGRVTLIEMKSQSLNGRYVNRAEDAGGFDFHTTLPVQAGEQLLSFFEANDVEVKAFAEQSPLWLNLLLGFLPWVFLIALFMWSSRALRARMGQSGGMLNFGRSRARRYSADDTGPGYEDVAGLENAKEELQEIVDYLKHPEKYRALGAKMPRGILLMGSPGTGKTLLARATAAEAGVPFFSVSGSEFIEMYVGVGASRVRDTFAQGRKEAPALIFIDEIDSIGRVRGTGMGGGNDEREQTLNQILAEMDGFQTEEAVVVLAATNRPDVLDPALLRPGRFDRKITLDLPHKLARLAILRVHTRKVPLADGVDLQSIAAGTVGFSGADLENLVNEAALLAAWENRSEVTAADFSGARDRIVMGLRRGEPLGESERQRIACHEAGHAITAYLSGHSDPVSKVSIVPRGRALGMTEQLPVEERHNLEEPYLQERLKILLGGRCAEKIVFGSVSSGAADDLQQATKLARHMVAHWGMSEDLGPVGFRVGEEHPFLGRELSEPRDFSEATAERMDQEVIRMLSQAENRCCDLLAQNRVHLDRLIEELLLHEVLDADQIAAVMSEPGG